MRFFYVYKIVFIAVTFLSKRSGCLAIIRLYSNKLLILRQINITRVYRLPLEGLSYFYISAFYLQRKYLPFLSSSEHCIA